MKGVVSSVLSIHSVAQWPWTVASAVMQQARAPTWWNTMGVPPICVLGAGHGACVLARCSRWSWPAR